MEFAPVLIPTLNRRDHLKDCLASLSTNSGADKTDIIISLDFPPNEKYVSGYKEVKQFLEQDQSWKGVFRSFRVFFQEKNLGPYDNAQFLYQEARKTSDRCIFTEDDNIFAPNFLDYINIGLDVFESDERIIGICGRKESNWIANEGDTIAVSKLCPSYGIGIWFKKEKKTEQETRELLLSKETYSMKSLLNLRRKNSVLFNKYISSILLSKEKPFWNKDKLAIIDTTRAIYMYLTDHYCIVPSISKAHTTGNDGSGVNMKKDVSGNIDSLFPLDNQKNFSLIVCGKKIKINKEYDPAELKYFPENDKLAEKYMRKATSWKGDIRALVGMLSLLIHP